MNPYIGFCQLGDKLKAAIAKKKHKLCSNEGSVQTRRYVMVVEYRMYGGIGERINYATVAASVFEAINKAKAKILKDYGNNILEDSIIVTNIYSEPV